MSVTADCLAAGLDDIAEHEVARARAQLKVSLLMALESSSARADQMARHLIAYGRLITPAEIVGRIDAITPDDVRRVGRAILASAPTLSTIGPTRPLAGVDRIAARFGAPAPA